MFERNTVEARPPSAIDQKGASGRGRVAGARIAIARCHLNHGLLIHSASVLLAFVGLFIAPHRSSASALESATEVDIITYYQKLLPTGLRFPLH